ncbi:MAG: Probable integrase/recombinase [uncultured Thermomicrobiales bacterium]|uniref:Probable integrase/recombinase n=1 Tax=uncultured Thermomicrobiales bacterium TaxID=1645740 RepID=A0A6J4VQE1_9BACT|nr:MAG: Probable integrase/recombinase [uncultured Thermomicrobiales bacterium]
MGGIDERSDGPERPQQATLFEIGKGGKAHPVIASVSALAPDSPVAVAIHWYRRHLEQGGHARNTIESYCYDLALFEGQTRPKPIEALKARDIARFLGDSETRSTRKRRLTSLSGFFKFLVGAAKVLPSDPSENFYPDPIPLKTPRPLFAAEQERLLAAAAADSARAHAALWLMLRLGVSRGELLNLRTDHIDLSDESQPVVYIYYDNPRWSGKERHLKASAEFTPIYRRLLDEYQPDGKLFPILPQSVNKIVERIVEATGIGRDDITPQTLRDSYAVDQARAGADEDRLIAILGLADDPRNRHSVGRYLKLGAAPL